MVAAATQINPRQSSVEVASPTKLKSIIGTKTKPNMGYSFLLIVTILSVFRCSIATPIQSCEDEVHVVCGRKEFHDSLDDFDLLNEETLNLHCSDILEDIECKRNYLSTCDPNGAESFALVADGIKNVLNELCNDTTDLRKAYRKHFSCISSALQDYENCIMNTVDNAETLDDDDPSQNDILQHDDTVRRMCRFYNPFKSCVREATIRICGNDAAQMVEQIIVRMATPAVSAKCANKTK